MKGMKILLLLLFLHQLFCKLHGDTYSAESNLSNSEKRVKKLFYKIESNGCLTKEYSNQSAVIYGNDCKNYPFLYKITKTILKIKVTRISQIKKNDFYKLTNITTLIFENNLDLKYLEPGCFTPMKSLIRLKITLNYNLRVLHETLFQGLDNLEQLILRKNGFTHVSDASQALSPKFIPKLVFLDLSENYIQNISKNDFKNMINSNLTDLQLSLCGLTFIDKESLLLLKNLKTLFIDGNHLDLPVLNNVILKLIEYNISLDSINLQDSGYGRNLPYDLLQVLGSTNISKVSLAENQFERIYINSFPPMHELKSLDLSDNIIISIDNDSFSGLISLEELYLAGNKFIKVFPAILLPHLKLLDLSRISNKPTAISYFTIENNIFGNMSMLQELRLSYNLIETTDINTFTGLTNLKHLDIRNATIYNFKEYSFINTPKLLYLNVENNPMKAIVLNKNNFAGLSNLKTLRLGGCYIMNLTVYPSPFYNLSSLTYLGLNNNIIYTLTPHIFAPLVSLKSLDLSNNKIIPWNKSLFTQNNLKFIDLSQNKLTRLSKAMLEDFKTIENISLDGNPFICDCHLFPDENFGEVLSNKNYTSVLEANCSNVEFQDKSVYKFIIYLKNNPNFCNPGSANKSLIVTLSSIFMIMLCIILILCYIYRNYLKYWIFLIKLTIQRHSKWWKRDRRESFPNFKYDAFVSYSCLDCYFVNALVSQLENKEPYLKLCIYERDFKIGSIISEEVMQNILKSKRTLLVISDGFAKSQWCRWETKLAEHHQIFFQNDDSMYLDDTLVMVKLNDVPKKYITPTLKYLMKTRIYLEWDKSKEHEFWRKLRNTLSAPKHGSSANRKH